MMRSWQVGCHHWMLHRFFPMLAIKMLDLNGGRLPCTSIGPVNAMNHNHITIGIQTRMVSLQDSTGLTKASHCHLCSPFGIKLLHLPVFLPCLLTSNPPGEWCNVHCSASHSLSNYNQRPVPALHAIKTMLVCVHNDNAPETWPCQYFLYYLSLSWLCRDGSCSLNGCNNITHAVWCHFMMCSPNILHTLVLTTVGP